MRTALDHEDASVACMHDEDLEHHKKQIASCLQRLNQRFEANQPMAKQNIACNTR
jgi:hypothetical protein